MKYILLTLLVLFFNQNLQAYSDASFIDELIADGDYFRAMTFAKKSEFNFRGTSEGYLFQQRILKLHLLTKDYENLEIQLDKISKKYSTKMTHEPIVYSAELSFLVGNYADAYNKIVNTEEALEKKYYFRAHLDEPEKMKIEKCETEVCNTILNLQTSIRNPKAKKNEMTALSLGIIPGLGQIYAGNIKSGVATFILNGFFIGTSISAFNSNEDVLGYVSAIVGSTFYLSSIYAGYETARRYNLAEEKKARSQLRNVPIQFRIYELVF